MKEWNNMAGRSNLDELLDVLEDIRREEYPHIPSEVIRNIVIAQYENQDKRLEARNNTTRIIAEFLNSVDSTEE